MNDRRPSGTRATRMRELWFEAPRHVTLRQGAEPSLMPGSVRVRAIASGISQGTEMLLYRGEAPTPFDLSLEGRSCATYPCRYGYCWVGEVTDRASDVKDISIGTHVFALAPHGDVHVLPETNVNVLQAEVPPIRGVLVANLETALTGIWDSGVSLGDRIVIFGAGVVGLLTAWLASKCGADVTLVETCEARRQIAARFDGIRVVETARLESLPESDIVVEATGNPATLDDAIRCAGLEARIVVLSFYGARRHPVLLGDRFHRRRLSLKSSQVSRIPADRAARWSHKRRFELVRQLLRDPKLDEFVGYRVPFDDAPAIYAALDRDPGSSLQTVFVY